MNGKIAAVAALLCAWGFAGLARAQERIPQDHAQQAAKEIAEKAKDLAEPQVKTDVDTDKPFGIHHEQHAVLVIPQKGFSAESFEKAKDGEVVPVGQLWLKSMSPVVKGDAADPDKLRTLTVSFNNEEHRVAVCLLGARKKDDGSWELLVFGKDKEPLLRLPVESEEKAQEMPIDLEGKRTDDGNGELILRSLGKYKATLVLAPKDL